MICESVALIKFQSILISAINLQMDGIHTHLAGFVFEKCHRLPPISPASVGGVNIQFVDERIVAVELETEAYGQHDIADWLVPFAKEPNSPECGERQEPPEGRTCRGLAKLAGPRFLLCKIPHHAEKFGFVLESRFPDQQWRHVTHRFVQ